MFKKIPGNHDYILSLNSEIRKVNGDICDLPIANNFVSINLYGKNETVDLFWLSLITHFEVKLPEHYKNIKFVECNPVLTNSSSGKIMVFARPILINKKYRVIPNYTDYAISKEGKIFEIESNKEIVKIDIINNYPSVSLYDPDRCFFKKMLIHRLVSLAWCHNDDYFGKPIVNHKDGNKTNYHASNLEWCSYSHNAQHAIDTGLKGIVKKYKVRDLETDTVKTYDSFKQVCLDIGLHENTRFVDKIYRKKTKIVRDRYEVKELEDLTPWMSNEEASVKKNKYTITLTNPDGSNEIFYTITDLMKRLKIWNISYNIDEIIKVADVKYPDIKIDVIDNFPESEVQALNVKTGEVTNAKSIRELSRILNLGFSTIHKAINNPNKYDCKGYVFRYKTNDPWNTDYKRHPNAAKHIRAKNVTTNEEINFPTMESAFNAFKTTYFVIRSKIDNKTQLGDWMFKEILSL
ncbi:MAG: hypothetical protein ACD_33C00046G0007 [uncultured bacterium]|nr:MAG: hypothetical protein ACD_33C00046G0007 [uncultured bacterium]